MARIVTPLPSPVRECLDLDAFLVAKSIWFPKCPVLEVNSRPICPGEASLEPHHPDPGVVHRGHSGCQEVGLGLGVDTGQVSIVSVRPHLVQTGVSSFIPGNLK